MRFSAKSPTVPSDDRSVARDDRPLTTTMNATTALHDAFGLAIDVEPVHAGSGDLEPIFPAPGAVHGVVVDRLAMAVPDANPERPTADRRVIGHERGLPLDQATADEIERTLAPDSPEE